MAEQQRSAFEEIKVASNQLVERVREIIREGDARRVIIKKDEHVYFEIPLTYGLGGAMAAIWLAPTLAAVGAVAALVTDVELVVEKRDGTEVLEEADIVEEVQSSEEGE